MRQDTAFMDRIHAYVPGWDIPKLNPDLFTGHFGLVSDFISECWSQLRTQTRLSRVRDHLLLGAALSGRDITAVNKTLDGLLKLLYPHPEAEIPDEDVEWAVRLALECWRRVKEQQKRIGSAEFRNTQFSYRIGEEGVEHFVATPELQSDEEIGADPLPPGQVWALSPGGQSDGVGLYRIEVNEAPGSGVKVINRPVPAPFSESLRCAEQNLVSRSRELVGDREPRQHEFTVQLRAFDPPKTGAALGVPVLLAMAGALLEKSLAGGLVAVGHVNLGGGQFARHLNAAGVPWESMHFELSRSKLLYVAPHPAADLKPSWRVDLAIVDREALLTAQPPFTDDRFRFEAFFEFALAGNFWQHGAAYGHPTKLRSKVAADVEKVGRYLEAGICDLAYVIVFEECDHAFPDGYADSVASTQPGVEVRVLRGW